MPASRTTPTKALPAMLRKSLILGTFLTASAFLRPAAPPTSTAPPTQNGPALPPTETSVGTLTPGVLPQNEGPWTALCKSLLFQHEYAGPPAARDDDPWSCIGPGTTFEFLLASAPDPKATNLALYFDRTLESLMWAAGDAKYS